MKNYRKEKSYSASKKRHILKKTAKNKSNQTIASNRESIVNSVMAGLLTCNIFTILPIYKTVDIIGKNWFVTYSCATVRDLHTIPF